MFSPRFTITNKILASVVEIEKVAQVLEIVTLEPEWEMKLKQECLVRRATAAVSFGETQLSGDDVGKIVKDEPGRDDRPAQVALRVGVVAKERDIQKTMNWLNAQRLVTQTAYLASKFKQDNFSEKDLESLNSILGERTVSVTNLGVYREKGPGEFEGMDFPPAIEVPYQMEDLFLWFKGVGKTDLNPVIKAGVMLLELIRIRPFADDNLMTGLFFFGLVLACEGLGMKEMWAYEEDLLRNKGKLVEVAKLTIESGDMTGWFEFLTKAVMESAEKTKIKVLNLVGDRPVFKTEVGKAISLSERQILIMEEMTIQGEMTIKEIRAILPMVSDDTILRDLKDIMTKKLIKKKGKTKGAVYILGKVKGFK